MATGVAERAIAPGGSTVAPPGGVRVRAAGVAWGWRVFLGAVFLLLFGPLVILVLFSFNDSNILAFPLEGVTLHWYGDAFRDQLLREALVNSIVVAAIVAPVCLVLGTLAAFGLTRFRFRGRSAVGGLVGAPLILPWLIIGIAALMFYVRFDVDLSLKTVIGTQIVCTFPLVTAIVAAQLFRFQRVQEEAAIDLGCSRMQVLRYIILPQAARRMIPLFFLLMVEVVKTTTLAGVVTYPEIVYDAFRVATEIYRPIETFTIVGIICFIFLFTLGRIALHLERRFAVVER